MCKGNCKRALSSRKAPKAPRRNTHPTRPRPLPRRSSSLPADPEGRPGALGSRPSLPGRPHPSRARNHQVLQKENRPPPPPPRRPRLAGLLRGGEAEEGGERASERARSAGPGTARSESSGPREGSARGGSSSRTRPTRQPRQGPAGRVGLSSVHHDPRHSRGSPTSGGSGARTPRCRGRARAPQPQCAAGAAHSSSECDPRGARRLGPLSARTDPAPLPPSGPAARRAGSRAGPGCSSSRAGPPGEVAGARLTSASREAAAAAAPSRARRGGSRAPRPRHEEGALPGIGELDVDRP